MTKVFAGFLILIVSAILWAIPIGSAIYDFKTDHKIDLSYSSTGVAETTENITLAKTIYEADSSTLTLLSDFATDLPVLTAYAAGNHTVLIGGLTENTTRTLTLTYDVDALGGSAAIASVADKLPWIWYLILFGFPICGLVYIIRK